VASARAFRTKLREGVPALRALKHFDGDGRMTTAEAVACGITVIREEAGNIAVGMVTIPQLPDLATPLVRLRGGTN